MLEHRADAADQCWPEQRSSRSEEHAGASSGNGAQPGCPLPFEPHPGRVIAVRRAAHTVASYPATADTSGSGEAGAACARTRSLDGEGRCARGDAGRGRERARRHGLGRARRGEPDLRAVRVRVRPDRGRPDGQHAPDGDHDDDRGRARGRIVALGSGVRPSRRGALPADADRRPAHGHRRDRAPRPLHALRLRLRHDGLPDRRRGEHRVRADPRPQRRSVRRLVRPREGLACRDQPGRDRRAVAARGTRAMVLASSSRAPGSPRSRRSSRSPSRPCSSSTSAASQGDPTPARFPGACRSRTSRCSASCR